MSTGPWGSKGKFGSSLALLLLGLLALSGILVYQVQDSVRSHRAASESALSDYAAFASWELGVSLGSEVDDLALDAYDAHYSARLDRSAEAPPLAAYAAEVREETADCGCPDAIPAIFSFDLGTGTLEVIGSFPSPAVGSWIADSLTVAARGTAGTMLIPTADLRAVRRPFRGSRDPRRADLRIQSGFPGAPELNLLYSVVRGPDTEPTRAFGFLVDVPVFAAAWADEIIATAPLLPPSLTGSFPNSDLLSISLAYRDGEPFYTLEGPFDPRTEVVDTLPTRFGPISVRVAVRPEVANRLVIGGLPRSRLPLLVGVFLLTLALSVIAIVQLRREQELIRLRGRFIASVSHELRTPLAQIRLFAELLGSRRLREEQRERAVRVINDEAQRLTYLVENVLRFSRAEQRLDRVTLRTTDLSELVREIVAASTPLASAQHTVLRTQLEPGIVARVDRDAFRQVLLNLLDNAIKYGRRDQTVLVGLTREGRRARLWVDDEGPGIPPGDRSSIWEPYRRLQRDVEATTGGSGIGLAVVRELVELHGGEVSVQESPAGGARFVVRVPTEAVESEEIAEGRLEQSVGGPA